MSNQSIALGSLCDNIELDHKTGDIWLACHPNGMKLLSHNPEDPPGSEVSVFTGMIYQRYDFNLPSNFLHVSSRSSRSRTFTQISQW